MSALSPMLDLRRAEAAKQFRARGIPNRRFEDWKYSDLRAAASEEIITHPGSAIWCVVLPKEVEWIDLAEADQLPEWVVRNFGYVGQFDNAMNAASLAFAAEAVALRIPAGQKVTRPLVIKNSVGGHIRILLVVEESASITICEEIPSADEEFENIGFEMVLAEAASVQHVRTMPPLPTTTMVENILVKVASDATYRAHFADFGAKLSRTELHIALEGEGAQAHLSGVSVLEEAGHADVTTRITHAVGNTQSTQLFKIIAGGKSRGVYQGKISVAEGANGSDSRQTAKGLLLGERAEIDLKPELEILADDVKCAHGAAVGDLDPESRFYQRSRGVAEAESRALLMRAIHEYAVSEVADETIRAEVWSRVEAALAELSE